MGGKCNSENVGYQANTFPKESNLKDNVYVGMSTQTRSVLIKEATSLHGSSLKLVDKFTYLGINVSSTESDINTRLAKAWTAIGHMAVRPDR